MWLILLLWLQTPEHGIEHRTVTNILRTIPVSGDNGHLVSLYACSLTDDHLLLLDRDSLKVASVGLSDGKVTFFSGLGQAPGELNSLVHSFFVEKDLLRVFHANGKRLDLFHPSGQHISSDRLDEPGEVLFLDERGTVTRVGQDPKTFRLSTRKGVAEVEAFPMKVFGFYLRTALFQDRYFLVANKSANKDLFIFVVFDMTEGTIQGPFEVVPIDKKYENGTPSWVLKSLRKKGVEIPDGRPNIFMTMLNPVVVHDNFGFMMCEESESTDPTFTVHLYDPRSKARRLMRIKKGPLQIPRFFLPLEDKRWVTFDSEDDEIVIFNMKK